MPAALRVVANNPGSRTWEQFVDETQGLVWNAIQKRQTTIGKLAEASHLCPTTVINFAERKTKRPQAKTVYLLAEQVGYRLAVVPANAPLQPDEIDMRKYRS